MAHSGEPLSADECQALIRYLKTLSENLSNVVQLMQKRAVTKQKLLGLALTAQMNIEVLYEELAANQRGKAVGGSL